MDATAILLRSESATFEVVADEAILIHMESGSYFSLNKLGTEFWEMLDGEKPICNHASGMAQKYAVADSQVTTDLLELSDRLLAASLVTIVNL